MDFKDYYKTLGLERTATEEEVRKAYRKLARKFHPDVSKEPDAQAKMRELNEANDVLRDKEKRAAYDDLADQVARGHRPGASGPGWEQGFDFRRGANAGTAHRSNYGDQGDYGDYSDFFSAIFGQGDPRGGERRGGERRPYRARGEDQTAAIEISIEDAIRGVEREMVLPAHNNRTLSVKIPAGVHPGQHIRLAGQGQPGYGGEPPGDLFLEVHLKPHPLYRVDGKNLSMNLPVTPTEAALGAQVKVPTPGGGEVEVTVPPNSRGGMKLRLKGRGLQGKTPGDLYLPLEIVLPPATTDAARQAYEQLAKAAPLDPRRHWFNR